jgi:hypothetical protein
LKAISRIAFDPNTQTSGIKLEIVKFFTLDELLREKTGCRWARNDRKITPQAQTSTADVYNWKLKRASGGIYPLVPVRF